MRLLGHNNIKMAVGSIKMAKMRSFLTMLGIIIGVASVVTIVSVGGGVKHQVNKQINQLGRDLITVRPGEPVRHQSDANSLRDSLGGVRLFYGTSNVGSLADEDIDVVRHVPGVAQAVPLSLVNGPLMVGGQEVAPPLVLATTTDMNAILHQPIEYGEFFAPDLTTQPDAAVIGHDVANRLFGQRSPLGQSFDFLGQRFFVRGVMKQFDATPLSLTTDFNDVIFIPYQTAQTLTNKNAQLYQILVKPQPAADLNHEVTVVTDALRNAHGGQQAFSVLRQDEDMRVANTILDLLTKLIAGVAAVSLLVGGIGVMNVMLVSVAERTHEIGLRKALGATNRQIWLQFLTEAGVLSLAGGIAGVLLALVVGFVLRVSTSLSPVLSWQAIVVSVSISWLVGIIFGTAPALKASRKDPIESLRSNL
jgi:ABC-type antimicrobial peptide transport system permease subunit